ncbi:hypothetical protein BHE18_04640 [Rossellomorea aquimaris]|uniref:Uncharacterized protein n=1 Tax=Rossellomorea aquimaris TaxID=189382 RepID=A0A1J6W2X3_9BACI|nr:hypothetical protein BHE18_04640 [Rossellomorea aquimaris]
MSFEITMAMMETIKELKVIISVKASYVVTIGTTSFSQEVATPTLHLLCIKIISYKAPANYRKEVGKAPP